MVWFAVYYGTYEPHCDVSIRSISCSDVDVYEYREFKINLSYNRFRITEMYKKTNTTLDPVFHLRRKCKSVDLVACLRCIKILNYIGNLGKLYDDIVNKYKLQNRSFVEYFPCGFVRFMRDMLSGRLRTSCGYVHYIIPYDISQLEQLMWKTDDGRFFMYREGLDAYVNYPPRYIKFIFKCWVPSVNSPRHIAFIDTRSRLYATFPCPRAYLTIMKNYIQEESMKFQSHRRRKRTYRI